MSTEARDHLSGEAVEQLSKARGIMRDSLVCEAMLPWNCTDRSHAILGRYRSIGFDFISITAATDDSPGDAAGDALRTLARIRALLAERPDDYLLAGNADDICRARREGRLAVGFNFQGSLPFGKSIELVPVFAALGVRQVLLAYNQMNFACDGCSERTDAGLSKVGVRLVKALQSHGVIVDGTHCGRRATLDAMEHASSPFIFSHSNAHSVYPHYRNITDEQIRACAATGGFVGVNGLNLFLGDESSRSETMFRHIDHIVSLVGPEHAAIGFDYVQFEAPIDRYYEQNEDVWPTNPFNGRPMRGIRSAQPEQIVELTAIMLAHGYDWAAVTAILGGNYLRVATGVWGSSAVAGEVEQAA